MVAGREYCAALVFWMGSETFGGTAEMGAALLAFARERGVRVRLMGEALWAEAEAGAEEALLESLMRHADAVVAALQATPNGHPEWNRGAGDRDVPYVFELDAAEAARLRALKTRLTRG